MASGKQVFGALLFIAGLAIIANAFQAQLISAGVGSTLGVPTFITDFFTPDVTSAQQTDGAIGFIILVIGLILIAFGGTKKQ